MATPQARGRAGNHRILRRLRSPKRAETSKRTTHEAPVYEEEGVLHYCVGNMPAARPQDASAAISEAALPYVLDIANAGLEAALRRDPGLRDAVLVWQGRIVHETVAAETGVAYTALTEADLLA